MAFDACGDVERVQYLGWGYRCDFEVDYKSQDRAAVVFATLDVDKELQPDKVKRQMCITDGRLKVRFEAVEARFLRASFSAFVDLLILATKFIEEYDQCIHNPCAKTASIKLQSVRS